jgi:hypothetical protein
LKELEEEKISSDSVDDKESQESSKSNVKLGANLVS